MLSWITRGFWYGVGASTGRALFGEDERPRQAPRSGPVRPQTEEEILADEKRFEEEERQLDANDAAARAARQGG